MFTNSFAFLIKNVIETDGKLIKTLAAKRSRCRLLFNDSIRGGQIPGKLSFLAFIAVGNETKSFLNKNHAISRFSQQFEET